MKVIDPQDISVPELQHYLQSAIAPRPIAFVASVSAEGDVNLSPFSFFNLFSLKPPVVVFSPSRRGRDGSTKHTLENVLEVPEVTVNIVDYAMVEQMSLASCEYPRGVNEFVKSGFTPATSERVRPPRVAESKAVFECKVLEVKPLGTEGGAGNLVICEVLLAHFDDSILGDDGRIDQRKTDWVARMGGNWYARAQGAAIFEVPKPNTHLGVGVDALPEWARHSPTLSGNDLGRLGNETQAPDAAAVEQFRQQNPGVSDWAGMAKTLLAQGRVQEAWMALLNHPG